MKKRNKLHLSPWRHRLTAGVACGSDRDEGGGERERFWPLFSIFFPFFILVFRQAGVLTPRGNRYFFFSQKIRRQLDSASDRILKAGSLWSPKECQISRSFFTGESLEARPFPSDRFLQKSSWRCSNAPSVSSQTNMRARRAHLINPCVSPVRPLSMSAPDRCEIRTTQFPRNTLKETARNSQTICQIAGCVRYKIHYWIEYLSISLTIFLFFENKK